MAASSPSKPRQPESAAQRAVVSLLVSSALVLQRINELCRRHGVTHDQYNLLRILRGAQPDGLARLEIGKRLISRAPDVTRLVDRLERQGLVERGWAPENRRYSVTRITPAGLELLATVDPELHALQREITRGLSADELETFSRTCDRLAG